MKTRVNRRKVKEEIFSLLESSTISELKIKLSLFPRIPLINALFMALCDANERIKWHAVSSFGQLIPEIAEEEAESARVIMRRFLWTLNDESGGIGWGAPESMAEIMCHSELLRQEYLHMLISYMREDGEELFQDGNFLELPLLQRGLLWGIGTLCQSFPEEMRSRGVEDDLVNYLGSADPEVRHTALWALSELRTQLPAAKVDFLNDPSASIRLYVNGSFEDITLKSIYDRLTIH